MGTKTTAALALALLLAAYASGALVSAALAQERADPPHEDEESTPFDEGPFDKGPLDKGARMVIAQGKDIGGHVFKCLGLPNQNYCWAQCLQEARCSAARWGAIEGATAGQCQLLDGELTFDEPREIKTGDGQRIVIVASKKEAGTAERTI